MYYFYKQWPAGHIVTIFLKLLASHPNLAVYLTDVGIMKFSKFGAESIPVTDPEF